MSPHQDLQTGQDGQTPNTPSSSPRLRLIRADTLWARATGVWRQPVSAGLGLWLLPCRGVHTLGLRSPLDVVFLDADGRIVQLRRQVAPNRMVWQARAHSVVELAGGEICRYPDFAQTLQMALQAASG